MADIEDELVDGATPLDPDEAAGLIPKHIATQGELNEFEQMNILQGEQWAFARNRPHILTEDYVRKLHVQMFNKTWRWAGKFRQTEKTIGVDPIRIAVMLRDLLNDASAWREFQTYPVDEQGVRLHHRLVHIHPFPNGNGRHARLFADVFMRQSGATPFSWGSANLTNPSETRLRYIDALKAADAKDYAPLLSFSRS